MLTVYHKSAAPTRLQTSATALSLSHAARGWQLVIMQSNPLAAQLLLEVLALVEEWLWYLVECM